MTQRIVVWVVYRYPSMRPTGTDTWESASIAVASTPSGKSGWLANQSHSRCLTDTWRGLYIKLCGSCTSFSQRDTTELFKQRQLVQVVSYASSQESCSTATTQRFQQLAFRRGRSRYKTQVSTQLNSTLLKHRPTCSWKSWMAKYTSYRPKYALKSIQIKIHIKVKIQWIILIQYNKKYNE